MYGNILTQEGMHSNLEGGEYNFIGLTIGVVNKGRRVTLNYFITLIKINKEHT